MYMQPTIYNEDEYYKFLLTIDDRKHMDNYRIAFDLQCGNNVTKCYTFKEYFDGSMFLMTSDLYIIKPLNGVNTFSETDSFKIIMHTTIKHLAEILNIKMTPGYKLQSLKLKH